jgi:hypothetical protein
MKASEQKPVHPRVHNRREVHAWVRVRPNDSLERTSTGKALGLCSGQCHHPLRGPSALLVASAQLKR